MELNALLWKTYNNYNENRLYPLPSDGRVSFVTDAEMPDSYWAAIGYKCLNKFVLRVDVFERIFYLARQKSKFGPFLESSDLMNPIGCNSDQLENILKFCEFESIKIGNNKKLFYFKLSKEVLTKEIKIKSKKSKKKIKINKNKKNTIKIKNKNIKIKKINDLIDKKIKTEKISDPNSPFAVLQKLL